MSGVGIFIFVICLGLVSFLFGYFMRYLEDREEIEKHKCIAEIYEYMYKINECVLNTLRKEAGGKKND